MENDNISPMEMKGAFVSLREQEKEENRKEAAEKRAKSQHKLLFWSTIITLLIQIANMIILFKNG